MVHIEYHWLDSAVRSMLKLYFLIDVITKIDPIEAINNKCKIACDGLRTYIGFKHQRKAQKEIK